MDFLVLTKSTTFIIGPVAQVMGYIMNAIFNFCDAIGFANIGLAIILFTIIANLLQLPLTVKQQKYTKVTSIMNPELQAVQKKYAGKKDQSSQMKMQAETQAVYDKYGVSVMGSCSQLLITFPIILALYRVVLNVPAYVDKVGAVFNNVATALQAQPDFVNKISDLATAHSMAIDKYDFATNTNYVIDLLYKFKSTDWDTLKGLFTSISDVISTNVVEINKMNSFIGGIVLSDAPVNNLMSAAILIPILAGLTQFLSSKMMSPATTTSANSEMPGANMMKNMNIFMPIMSVVICFTLPCGVGLYWIAGTVCRIIIQFFINRQMGRMDVDDIIKQNIAKQNKKRARKGLPAINEGQVIRSANKARLQLERDNKYEVSKEVREENEKKSADYYKSKNNDMSSIASKARMVQDYNEKRKKK